jgi:hypothetical protein
MDDLRNKLGKLFGNAKGGGGKGFRGQGHVLGSAGQSGAGCTTATSTPTARTRAPASTAAAAAPSQPAGSSASQLPVGPARTVGTRRTEATAAHKVTPPTATVDDGFVARVTEAGETAIAVLVSGGEGTPTAATLRKVGLQCLCSTSVWLKGEGVYSCVFVVVRESASLFGTVPCNYYITSRYMVVLIFLIARDECLDRWSEWGHHVWVWDAGVGQYLKRSTERKVPPPSDG